MVRLIFIRSIGAMHYRIDSPEISERIVHFPWYDATEKCFCVATDCYGENYIVFPLDISASFLHCIYMMLRRICLK